MMNNNAAAETETTRKGCPCCNSTSNLTVMTKREYIEHLKAKGYEILNDAQVTLGSLIFDIRETINHTGMGEQHAFCLKFSPESDMNLCPSPWN